MSSLSKSIFSRRSNESEGEYQDRVADDERTFRNALSGEAGHRLVHLLLSHVNPTHPRFGNGRTVEEAAFRDGQCDIIATLMLYGTNIGISKPNANEP